MWADGRLKMQSYKLHKGPWQEPQVVLLMLNSSDQVDGDSIVGEVTIGL